MNEASRRTLVCCWKLVGLCLFFVNSVVDAAGGKVTGRVYDQETGESLPGANVVIESIYQAGRPVELSQKQGAATDTDGYFVILNVPPGAFDIRASFMGYTALIKKQVRVNIDRTITVDFPLQMQAIAMDEVAVIAEREIIKPDIAGTQEIILTERVEAAPVLRIDEFVGKLKGVELVSGNDGHGLSIRGGAIRETDVRVDGISVRDPRSENSYLSLNSTSVAELQVLTGGFEAKFGGFRSGLVNAVTKEGTRERYNLALKFDITPANQRKFYGQNPWSDESWIYRVFADTSETGYAYIGARGNEEVPEEFRFFRGWNNRREGISNYSAIGIPDGVTLTPEQKRKLWQLQHPQYEFGTNPDAFIEATLTGPMPGARLPLIGEYLKNTTFLLGGKYEDTQYAFPLGPRDNYVDWNTQLKLTTRLNPDMKLAVNGLYAQVNTITAGTPTTYGGALIDNSSRFNFLSSTEVSVQQQARLLGGSNGFEQMFNRSRLQFYDQRYIIGGLKFTHAFSAKGFYTVDFQFSYNDHELTPFAADTTLSSSWAFVDSIRVLNAPTVGTPNASTNWLTDINNMFWLYGGLQSADSSYSWVSNLRADLTYQAGRHHQIEAGFSFKYNYLSINSGSWLQSEKSWTPDSWQYFTAKPIEGGVYVQDKLEFQGMIATLGLRGDYFNPQKYSYLVQHPLDLDYANFYNLVYQYLPGEFGSWERWAEFRQQLEEPEGWPREEKPVQFRLSPRLGVSFPVTVNSKLYFNYGHFYQRPNIHFTYNQAVMPGAANVPSPQLDMARTIAYEFGYEHSLFKDYLINLSIYYKDIKGEPLSRTYVDYWEELYVQQYFPDAYKDIRGIELRFEKSFGRFVTFWSNYEYMLQSSGRSGLARVYENRLLSLEEMRNPNISITQPLPRGHLNVNLHTPDNWGIRVLGLRPLSAWYANFCFEWRDGGEQIINPFAPENQQKKIQVVDYSNLDLRVSKMFHLAGMQLELIGTVQNLLDQKRLSFRNMSTAQYDRYIDSLHFPFESGDEKGDDKLGEWDKEHINVGWFTAPLFLNPQRILLGLRLNF
ncbi:TonB-dependent receptor [candidate division KSB1 bacterium]|nr:TonB-dependent receptor [candidate division KSB1 bacterium]